MLFLGLLLIMTPVFAGHLLDDGAMQVVSGGCYLYRMNGNACNARSCTPPDHDCDTCEDGDRKQMWCKGSANPKDYCVPIHEGGGCGRWIHTGECVFVVDLMSYHCDGSAETPIDEEPCTWLRKSGPRCPSSPPD